MIDPISVFLRHPFPSLSLYNAHLKSNFSLSQYPKVQQKNNIIICYVCLAKFKYDSKEPPTMTAKLHGCMILHRWREDPNVRPTEFHSVSCIYHHSSTLESTTYNPWFTTHIITARGWFSPVKGCVDPQHLLVPSLSFQNSRCTCIPAVVILSRNCCPSTSSYK